MNTTNLPTTAPLTELTLILDRSGSMASIANDAIGGFNTFLAAQQADQDHTRLSLVLFDNLYEVPYKSFPIAQVPPLTSATFIPRGGTALLDAIGKTIHKMTSSFAARLPHARPEKVIIAILTDGEENSSREYTPAHIADLIAAKQLQGWDFLFLAANQDAIATAARYHIPATDAVQFCPSPEGTADIHQKMDLMVRERKTRGKK